MEDARHSSIALVSPILDGFEEEAFLQLLILSMDHAATSAILPSGGACFVSEVNLFHPLHEFIC